MIPPLFDRPDKTGSHTSGVLFLSAPCRDSYKKAIPFPQDKIYPILVRQWERIGTLGGFQPRPLPRIQSNGPRVWAESVCFRAQIWKAASKKATHWMPDTRAAFFFDRKGTIIAIAMPYVAGGENPAVVPQEEYIRHGLDTTPEDAQEQFSLAWSRFTPCDLYQQEKTGHTILVPIDSTVADTLARNPEYRYYSSEGWEKVTPVEHKLTRNPDPVQIPTGPANTLTRLQWRLSLWYRNHKERAVRRAKMMPLESLRRILADEDARKAFGLDFCFMAEKRLSA